MMPLYRLIWRALRRTEPAPPPAPFARLGRQTQQAQLIVQFFFLYLLYVTYAIAMIEWLPRTFTAQLQLLWPLAWIQRLPVQQALGGLLLFAFGSGLAALLLPNVPLCRLAFLAAFFLLATFTNSYGRISHPYHALFLVQLVLLALPTGRSRSVGYQHRYLTVFWLAQLAVGMIYSMSGFWKVYYGIAQALNGQIGTFHPYALATLTAFRNLQTNQQSLLGWLVVEQPLLGWPLHYGALYVELFSLVAVFRPVTHRLWGALLIAFHIGTWLLIGVPFPTHVMLVGLLLAMSPFAPPQASWRDTVYSLPLLGDLLWLRERRRAAGAGAVRRGAA